jgi:hypothetical protein
MLKEAKQKLVLRPFQSLELLLTGGADMLYKACATA